MNPNELKKLFEKTESALGSYQNRQQENAKVRFCVWSGMSADGRKHSKQGRPARPWEGASDLRTFMVDDLVEGDVALLLASLQRSTISATPVGADDVARAGLVSLFIRWLLFSQCREWRREAQILANFFRQKGAGVLAVTWRREVAMAPVRVTLAELERAAAELAQGLEALLDGGGMPVVDNPAQDMLDAMLDPLREEEAAQLLQPVFPDVRRARLRAAVRELRKDGVATLYREQEIVNRPRLRALGLDFDLLVPPDTDDLQDAPAVFEVQYLTAEDLRARVDEGWDKVWVERVVESGMNASVSQTLNRAEVSWRAGMDETPRARVVVAYYRTQEEGVSATRYMVFCPDLGGFTGEDVPVAVDELVGYSPDRYPFIVFANEYVSRRLLDSRGMAEIGQGSQDEVKQQRDGRADRTQLSNVPPLYHPVGEAPTNWGPGAMVPRKMSGKGTNPYEYAEIPPPNSTSIEVERTVTEALRRRFGRAVSELDGEEARLRQELLVSNWLDGWSQVAQHMWHLWSQFGPEEQFFRVTGAAGRGAQQMVKGSQEEKFDFYFAFSVDSLDPERMETKLDNVGKVLSTYVRNGKANWDAFARLRLSAIDPTYADMLLLSDDDARAQEWNLTRDDLTRIWSGMDIDYPETGRDPQTSMEVLTNYVQGSETIPALDVQTRLQNDQAFAARIEKYQQQITFRMQQEENANTGRLGAPAGNMSVPMPVMPGEENF